MIRFLVDGYNKPVPAILEIPSKHHPYDPAHDSVLSRVKYLFSAESVARVRSAIKVRCLHVSCSYQVGPFL
jgi:V-type H+-transporting ATPase subunit F